MAAKKDTPNPEDMRTINDLSDLFGAMLERDQKMWDRLGQHDEKFRQHILEMFQRSLEAKALDAVLVNGFRKVSKSIEAQTAPLRSLGREYAPLSDEAAEELDALAVALTRQDFSIITDTGAIRVVG